MDLSSLDPQNKAVETSVPGPQTLKPKMIERPGKTIIGKLDETPKKAPNSFTHHGQLIQPSGFGVDSYLGGMDVEQRNNKISVRASGAFTQLNGSEDNRNLSDRSRNGSDETNSGDVKMPELTSLFAAR